MSAPIDYWQHMVGRPEADTFMHHFWEKLPWENREGAPRRECWFNAYGDAYTYGSGEHARTYQANNFITTPCGIAISQILMALNYSFKANFDSCFVNGYAHGRQHLGWHADDSPEMDMDHPIAVVSLGAEREIWFRQAIDWDSEKHAPRWGEPQKQMLHHGSVLLMLAGMQRDWQHRIPKSPVAECGPRISLTFRKLVR